MTYNVPKWAGKINCSHLDERAADPAPNALLVSLGEYRESEKFVDVTLTGKNGVSVKVHAAVVASAVPAILAKLTGNWQNAREFNVGDLDASQLRLFVDFCYSRDMAAFEHVNSTDLKQILKVSGELVATDMFAACVSALSHWCSSSATSLSDITSCYEHAKKHGAVDLVDKCVLEIFWRTEELSTEELMDLCRRIPELFAMVLKQVPHKGGGSPPPKKKARMQCESGK